MEKNLTRFAQECVTPLVILVCWEIHSRFEVQPCEEERSEFLAWSWTEVLLWSEPAWSRAVLSVNPELSPSLTAAPWLGRLPLLLPMGTVEPALLAQVITLIA